MSKSSNYKNKDAKQNKKQQRVSSIENDPTPEDNPFYGEESHKNS